MVGRSPGRALLHPLAMLSLALLLLNDHVLKRACPGIITGKLSDFAGVLLLPLFLHALFETSYVRIARRMPSDSASDRALGLAIGATVSGFALPEIWAPAETIYRVALAGLQWPVRASNEVPPSPWTA